MKIFDLNKRNNVDIVIALGFFDSIHVGHTSIIKKAQELAKDLRACSAVFTFENDIDKVVGGSTGLVLTFEERLKKLSKLSVDSVVSTVFTKEFSKLSPFEFFNLLVENFNVKAIACGRDYRFGYKGSGDVELMKGLCIDRGIHLLVVDDVTLNLTRVSTTQIKEFLLQGNIQKANILLGENYSISGVVTRGRAVGREMGFPTANVLIASEKLKIKNGVYKTRVEIDGKEYKCITNYGARPTFNLEEVLTETYIDGFKGDLYDKNITIYFDEYIRECVKFDSVEQLILQLQKDVEKIR